MTMGFPVAKSNGELVCPFEPTPSGVLPLSSLDNDYFIGLFIKTLHVFNRGGPGAAQVIRQALGRALVSYYPMAGRLVQRGESIQVDCTGDGVWFVEAAAGCSLEEVGWLQRQPLPIPAEQLLPLSFDSPADSTGMAVMMQVTEFSCGGFSVGTMFDHTMTDGIGMAQFLNAVADMARGLDRPEIEPIWCRDAIALNPPKVPPGAPPVFRTTQIQHFSVDVPSDLIGRLKAHFTENTGRICSTFDVITAAAWQCRTRAINIDPDAHVPLAFVANARPLALPARGGYYGNCVYEMGLTAPSGKIAQAPIFEVVNMIKDAKAMIPIQLDKRAKGEQSAKPERFAYQSLCVNDWRHLGFGEVDYGWGKPTYFAPLLGAEVVISFCCLLNPPAPVKGVRLLTWCFTQEHAAVFRDELVKYNKSTDLMAQAPSSLHTSMVLIPPHVNA